MCVPRIGSFDLTRAPHVSVAGDIGPYREGIRARTRLLRSRTATARGRSSLCRRFFVRRRSSVDAGAEDYNDQRLVDLGANARGVMSPVCRTMAIFHAICASSRRARYRRQRADIVDRRAERACLRPCTTDLAAGNVDGQKLRRVEGLDGFSPAAIARLAGHQLDGRANQWLVAIDRGGRMRMGHGCKQTAMQDSEAAT